MAHILVMMCGRFCCCILHNHNMLAIIWGTIHIASSTNSAGGLYLSMQKTPREIVNWNRQKRWITTYQTTFCVTRRTNTSLFTHNCIKAGETHELLMKVYLSVGYSVRLYGTQWQGMKKSSHYMTVIILWLFGSNCYTKQQ